MSLEEWTRRLTLFLVNTLIHLSVCPRYKESSSPDPAVTRCYHQFISVCLTKNVLLLLMDQTSSYANSIKPSLNWSSTDTCISDIQIYPTYNKLQIITWSMLNIWDIQTLDDHMKHKT